MIHESTVERWPGHIETDEFLRFPQLISWEKALAESKDLKDAAGVGEYYKSVLPVAISFVRKWHIVGLNVNADGSPIMTEEGKPLTVDYCNFPASGKLVSWLIDVVSGLFTSTNKSDPN